MLNLEQLETTTFTLALQDGGPELGGGGGGETSTGAPANGGSRSGGSTFTPDFMLIILLMFVVIIVWSIMGQRKERKKREQLLSSIRKHDQVQTVGGVIGSVVDIKKDTVVLKVDESSNTRMTFARSAIQQVLSHRDEPAKETPDDASK